MIKKLVDFCLKNTAIVIMIAAMIAAAGIWAIKTIPVDAFPDISENQVIVSTHWHGRSPDDVQDQITFPLTVELQGIPGVKQVRGISGFGFSRIYVVFDDNSELYWSRTRVLEHLGSLSGLLPEGVTPELGPDATPLGQIYWYTIEGPYDLGTLRSIQDYTVRYALQSVPGVSEVAGIGGHILEYQVNVDPILLYNYNIDMGQVISAVAKSNSDVGASTVESSSMEFVVRGDGQISGIEDIEEIVILQHEGNTVKLRDIADVSTGPAFRRGVLTDDNGEVAGGIVVMRKGENPVNIITGVEERLADITPGLPPGVTITPYYDRSELVRETVNTLSDSIIWEMLITLLVIFLFLMHLRSSLIVTSTLPFAVLLCFIAMRLLGISANIMSFAGIAIAIGTLVDMGIVVTENIHLGLKEKKDSPLSAIRDSVIEVAPAIFTSLATTVISFIPVFFLTGQSGRLFIPLAWTKTLVLISAGVVAVTLVPVFALMFISKDPAKLKKLRTLLAIAGISILAAWVAWSVGAPSWLHFQRWLFTAFVFAIVAFLSVRISREKLGNTKQQKISDGIIAVYEPVLRWAISHRRIFLIFPLLVIILGAFLTAGASVILSPLNSIGLDTERFRPTAFLIDVFPGVGTQFMPPLDEGSFLFMPSLLNQASLNETTDVMLRQNRAMSMIPEVDLVVGKAGRADSPLDPAPAGMIETVITLNPENTWREGVTSADILAELRSVTDMPGIAPSWLQPIETRIVMLHSGIKTNIGCEIHGTDYLEIERASLEIEKIITSIDGARDVSALRFGRKPYLEFTVNREAAAEFGVTVDDIQTAIMSAIGGVSATTVIDGRERSDVRVRYARDFRNETPELSRIFVRTMSGALIPVSLVADIEEVTGPAMIRSVDGELVGYVMFSAEGRDEGGLVEEADRRIKEVLAAEDEFAPSERTINLPDGYYFRWVGNYQNQMEAKRRLGILIPVCLLIVFLLMYLQFRTFAVPTIIFLGSVPLTAAGGIIFMKLWPGIQDFLFSIGIMNATSTGPVYMTVAVAVGFIALLGICVDDGVLMATYIKQLMKSRSPSRKGEIRELVVEAGKRRIRPAVMTTVTTLIALIPVIIISGRGSELSRPMALPVFGGMLIEFFAMLIVPVVYGWWLEKGCTGAETES